MLAVLPHRPPATPIVGYDRRVMTPQKGAEKGAAASDLPQPETRWFEDFERSAAAAVAERPSGGFVLRDDVRPAVGMGIAWDDPQYAGPWLVATGSHLVRVPILEHPRRLLRDFEAAAAAPTDAAIIALANRYGWLQQRVDLLPLSLRGTLPGANLVDDFEVGEQLSEWRTELERLHDLFEVRHAVRVLEADGVTPRDARRARLLLRDRVRRTPGGAVKYVSGSLSGATPYGRQRFLLMPGKPGAEGIGAYLAPDLELRGGRLYLSLEINDAMREGEVYPVLMPLRDNALRFFPRSVLAAVHLALVLELAGGMPERACAKCGDLFAATRRDREFCSRGCKESARKVRVRTPAPSRR